MIRYDSLTCVKNRGCSVQQMKMLYKQKKLTSSESDLSAVRKWWFWLRQQTLKARFVGFKSGVKVTSGLLHQLAFLFVFVKIYICLWLHCALLNALSITQRTSYTHPSREIWTTIQPARKATQLFSCREDFQTERTWLHYAHFVQRQLLVPFLFSILFIFDVAFC